MNRTPKQGLNNIEPIDAAFDVDELLNKCGVILQREIRNLLIRTSSGAKLDSAESRDLVSYVKLLVEAKASLEDAAKNMSEEDLKKLV